MFVDVGNASLHVARFGKGAPILMPTGGGVPFYGNTFSAELQEHLEFFAVEMRGTGTSTGSMQGQTFASLAQDLERVRAALGLHRPLVLGHSNHGCIALEFALQFPAAASGIASVASGPDFEHAFELGSQRWEVEAAPSQMAEFQRRQAEIDALDTSVLSADEVKFRRYLALSQLGWNTPDFDSEPLWGSAPPGLGAYFDWLFAYSPPWNVIERLAEIETPVLALSGRYDYLCPIELWCDAISSLPDGQLVEFEHSAHNPQYEEPAAFDAALLAFAERVQPGQ
jgi:proline iminopeptidase